MNAWMLRLEEVRWPPAFVAPLVACAMTVCAFGKTHAAELAGLEHLVEGQDRLALAGETIDVAALKPFYRARDFAPLWLRADGRLNRDGKILLDHLRSADTQGLVPEHFRVREIEAMRYAPETDPGALELLLSHLLIHYATDVGSGRLEPKQVAPDLAVFPRPILGPEILEGAAKADDLGAYLDQLAPAIDAYGKLHDALAELRKEARTAPWPVVPEGAALKPGAVEPRVLILRERLKASGDLQESDESDVFDSRLEEAVDRFQARQGLAADGVVGRATLAALNVPIEDRIGQIVLNMERLRWLPHDLGADYVSVNIAAFALSVMHQGSEVLSMRVVVGRTYRQTPVSASRIESIELNPYWSVPPSIARADLLPKILADPDYLVAHHYELFANWRAGAPALDPKTVDWRKIAGRGFPYKLRQEPGPDNALGRYRFVFPNKFDVYLHDTPTRALFEKDTRTFSSGCIRVEDAKALADYLFAGDPNWTPEALEAAQASGVNQSIRLQRPMPIVINYATAWVDGKGVLQFRPDIYGRDAALAAAFETSEERSAPARP